MSILQEKPVISKQSAAQYFLENFPNESAELIQLSGNKTTYVSTTHNSAKVVKNLAELIKQEYEHTVDVKSLKIPSEKTNLISKLFGTPDSEITLLIKPNNAVDLCNPFIDALKGSYTASR